MKTNLSSGRARGLRGLLAAGLFTALALPGMAAGTEVAVELWDKPGGSQGITLSVNEVKAGEVTFRITNSSKSLEHEFLVAKTDLGLEVLPMKEDEDKVDEDKLVGVEESGDIEEGESGVLTMTLTPGNYVLFCNEKGHYKAGMRTTFTVTP